MPVYDVNLRLRLRRAGINPDEYEFQDAATNSVSQAPTPTIETPVAKPGIIKKTWEFANTGLISPEMLDPEAFGKPSLLQKQYSPIGVPVEAKAAIPPESAIGQALLGGRQGLAEVESGLTSPLGLATFGVGPALQSLRVLPKAASLVQRGIAGAFATGAAINVPHSAKETYEAIKEGDIEKAVRSGIHLGADLTITGLAGKHALTKGGPFPEDIAKEMREAQREQYYKEKVPEITPIAPGEPIEQVRAKTISPAEKRDIKETFYPETVETEVGALTKLEIEQRKAEAEAKRLRKIAAAEERSRAEAEKAAIAYKEHDEAVRKAMTDYSEEEWAALPEEQKSLYRVGYERAVADVLLEGELKEEAKAQGKGAELIKVKEGGKVKTLPLEEKIIKPKEPLQETLFEEERKAMKAREVKLEEERRKPKMAEGEEIPVEEKADAINAFREFQQSIRDRIRAALEAGDINTARQIEAQNRGILERDLSKVEISGPASEMEAAQKLSEVAKKRLAPLREGAEKVGASLEVTPGWLRGLQKIGVLKNIKVDVSGRLFKEDGTEIKGLATLRKGLKTALIKLNPFTWTLDTGPHEFIHTFRDDFLKRGNRSEKLMIERGDKVISETPEYQEWAKLREATGKDFEPEEFWTTHAGEDVIRRILKTDETGAFRNWLKDFWNAVKIRARQAGADDYIRDMSWRILYEKGRPSISGIPSEVAFREDTKKAEPEEELPESAKNIPGIRSLVPLVRTPLGDFMIEESRPIFDLRERVMGPNEVKGYVNWLMEVKGLTEEQAYQVASELQSKLQEAGEPKPGVVRRKPLLSEQEEAPVSYAGKFEGDEIFPAFHMYNLTKDIKDHPKGSTITQETLSKYGYKIPEGIPQHTVEELAAEKIKYDKIKSKASEEEEFFTPEDKLKGQKILSEFGDKYVKEGEKLVDKAAQISGQIGELGINVRQDFRDYLNSKAKIISEKTGINFVKIESSLDLANNLEKAIDYAQKYAESMSQDLRNNLGNFIFNSTKYLNKIIDLRDKYEKAVSGAEKQATKAEELLVEPPRTTRQSEEEEYFTPERIAKGQAHISKHGKRIVKEGFEIIEQGKAASLRLLQAQTLPVDVKTKLNKIADEISGLIGETKKSDIKDIRQLFALDSLLTVPEFLDAHENIPLLANEFHKIADKYLVEYERIENQVENLKKAGLSKLVKVHELGLGFTRERAARQAEPEELPSKEEKVRAKIPHFEVPAVNAETGELLINQNTGQPMPPRIYSFLNFKEGADFDSGRYVIWLKNVKGLSHEEAIKQAAALSGEIFKAHYNYGSPAEGDVKEIPKEERGKFSEEDLLKNFYSAARTSPGGKLQTKNIGYLADWTKDGWKVQPTKIAKGVSLELEDNQILIPSRNLNDAILIAKNLAGPEEGVRVKYPNREELKEFGNYENFNKPWAERATAQFLAFKDKIRTRSAESEEKEGMYVPKDMFGFEPAEFDLGHYRDWLITPKEMGGKGLKAVEAYKIIDSILEQRGGEEATYMPQLTGRDLKEFKKTGELPPGTAEEKVRYSEPEEYPIKKGAFSPGRRERIYRAFEKSYKKRKLLAKDIVGELNNLSYRYGSEGRFEYDEYGNIYTKGLQNPEWSHVPLNDLEYIHSVVKEHIMNSKMEGHEIVIPSQEQFSHLTGMLNRILSNPEYRKVNKAIRLGEDTENPYFDRTRQSEPEEIPSYGWSAISSRYDKVAQKFKGEPWALEVTKKLHSFNGDLDRMEGQLANKNVALLSKYKTTKEENYNIVKYLYEMDDKGSSSVILSPKERALAKEFVDNMKDTEALKTSLGYKGVIAGVKSRGQFPNLIDSKVAYEWTSNPTSPQSKFYDRLFVKHRIDRGDTPENAKEALNKYKVALGKEASTDVEFFTPKEAEKYGLPFDMVERNLARVMTRYGRRAARDLMYFKYFQNDPRMLKAFNLYDQDGKIPTDKDVPDVPTIAGTDDAKMILRSIFNIDTPKPSPKVNALNRVIANTIMGVGTAASNLVFLPTYIAPYMKVKQLPLAVKALGHMFAAKRRAFQNNAIRLSFADFDAAGDYEAHPMKSVRAAVKMSYLMRKFQGRNLSDALEGQYSYALGELLAHDNLMAAKGGDEAAIRYVKRFGDTIKDIDTLLKPATKVLPEHIESMAKRFTDAVRGTYSAEGLPSWAIEGPFAPFVALNRFTIEKGNTIWKDAVIPAKNGNFGPILKLLFGAVLSTAAVEKLREILSNKRGPEPTFKEVALEGRPQDIIAKIIGIIQMSSIAGIVGDSAKMISNVVQGKTSKYINPASFPLYEATMDVGVKNLTDFFRALRNGEDFLDSSASFMGALATQASQSGRYAYNYLLPEEAKRKEKFRDVRIFKELQGTPPEAGIGGEYPDVISGVKLRKFKRESDVGKAVKMLPEIVTEAIEDANGDIEKLRANLLSIKRNTYQTMPNPETMPSSFLKYLTFLERTQGKEAAAERLDDYIRQRVLNKAKSEALGKL